MTLSILSLPVRALVSWFFFSSLLLFSFFHPFFCSLSQSSSEVEMSRLVSEDLQEEHIPWCPALYHPPIGSWMIKIIPVWPLCVFLTHMVPLLLQPCTDYIQTPFLHKNCGFLFSRKIHLSHFPFFFGPSLISSYFFDMVHRKHCCRAFNTY